MNSESTQPITAAAPARTGTRRERLVEDAEWMASTGETVPGAAARLHVHPHSLRTALARAGRPDLFARLLANQ